MDFITVTPLVEGVSYPISEKFVTLELLCMQMINVFLPANWGIGTILLCLEFALLKIGRGHKNSVTNHFFMSPKQGSKRLLEGRVAPDIYTSY